MEAHGWKGSRMEHSKLPRNGGRPARISRMRHSNLAWPRKQNIEKHQRMSDWSTLATEPNRREASTNERLELAVQWKQASGGASANEKVLLWIGVHGNSLISLLVVIFLLFNKTEIGLFLLFSISKRERLKIVDLPNNSGNTSIRSRFFFPPVSCLALESFDLQKPARSDSR